MKKIFWLDMEMTGLDVNKEVILEVAVVITDWEFKVLDSYEAVINQPQFYLDRMDDWNKDHHSKSGLLNRVAGGKQPEKVEEDLLALIVKHYPPIHKKEDKIIIAGNSIHQDKLFINKYFTRFAEMLHYRTLDVTSWKLVFNQKFGHKYNKKNAHRAVEDINETIEEFKFYLSFLHGID